jgi:hypothetical protein
LFEKITKNDKPLAKLANKREKTMLIKLEMKREILQQTPRKSKRLLVNI